MSAYSHLGECSEQEGTLEGSACLPDWSTRQLQLEPRPFPRVPTLCRLPYCLRRVQRPQKTHAVPEGTMATPGKSRPSGIPARGSAIPTPGTRARSTSTVSNGTGQHAPSEDEFMSRAFADAIRANDPAQHKPSRVSDVSTVSSLAPSLASSSSRRPSSVTSASSAGSFAPPRSATSRASNTSKVHPLPRAPSRGGDVFRSVSRTGRAFDIGDNVRIESLGFEGTLRYIGEIDGKQGEWAGVELSGGFKGKGKNNGSVAG